MDLEKLVIDRDSEAFKILQLNELERTPYILYLRKFEINIMHGKSEGERQFFEHQIFDSLPNNVNLITTYFPSDDTVRRLFSDKIPTLILGDNWKPLVQVLIRRAELIVTEFQFLSEGVLWELNTIIKENKNHATILLLPPINTYFETLDFRKPLDQFIRIIWADQLHMESALDNFVVKDLFKRIRKIAETSIEKRLQAYSNPDELNNVFPVTYEGVIEGFLERINDWTASIPSTDAFLSYYKFWDYYRLATLTGVLLQFMKDQDDDFLYGQLANSYINIVQFLCANPSYLDQDDSFLTKEKLFDIVDSIRPIISKIKSHQYLTVESMAEKTIQRAVQVFGNQIPGP